MNTIITLEDNTKYVLIDELKKDTKKYYFAIKLDKDENPTTSYEIFEEEKISEEKYMSQLESDEIKEEILLYFLNKYIKNLEEIN